MSEKTLKTRIIHKHDTAANWAKSSLIPKQAEIIIYDEDENHSYPRFKIGNGKDNVNDLPFVEDHIIEYMTAYADDAVAQKTQVQIVVWEDDD